MKISFFCCIRFNNRKCYKKFSINNELEIVVVINQNEQLNANLKIEMIKRDHFKISSMCATELHGDGNCEHRLRYCPAQFSQLCWPVPTPVDNSTVLHCSHRRKTQLPSLCFQFPRLEDRLESRGFIW